MDTLFAIMEGSPYHSRVVTLKSVNALFLQNPANCELIRKTSFWQHWLFSLLTDLNFHDVFAGSKDMSLLENLTVHANSSLLKQVYAYTMNVFTMIHHDAFLTLPSPQFYTALCSSIDSVPSFAGQNIKSQAIARCLLAAVATYVVTPHLSSSRAFNG